MITFIIQSMLLGIGLAMDASAVSMTDGLKNPKMPRRMVLFIAFLFSLFQVMMPLIGYLCGTVFTSFISKYLPWISLVLLGFIGGKMLYEGIKGGETEDANNVLTIKLIFIQAFATAIDALSVGIIMVDYTKTELLVCLSCIGIVTFILSYISIHLGKRFGGLLHHKAEIIGGVILIGIGLEIFISSFF